LKVGSTLREQITCTLPFGVDSMNHREATWPVLVRASEPSLRGGSKSRSVACVRAAETSRIDVNGFEVA